MYLSHGVIACLLLQLYVGLLAVDLTTGYTSPDDEDYTDFIILPDHSGNYDNDADDTTVTDGSGEIDEVDEWIPVNAVTVSDYKSKNTPPPPSPSLPTQNTISENSSATNAATVDNGGEMGNSENSFPTHAATVDNDGDTGNSENPSTTHAVTVDTDGDTGNSENSSPTHAAPVDHDGDTGNSEKHSATHAVTVNNDGDTDISENSSPTHTATLDNDGDNDNSENSSPTHATTVDNDGDIGNSKNLSPTHAVTVDNDGDTDNSKNLSPTHAVTVDNDGDTGNSKNSSPTHAATVEYDGDTDNSENSSPKHATTEDNNGDTGYSKTPSPTHAVTVDNDGHTGNSKNNFPTHAVTVDNDGDTSNMETATVKSVIVTDTNVIGTTSQNGSKVLDSKEVKLGSASTSTWFAPLIAAVTSGIVFFFVGYFVDKACKKRKDCGADEEEESVKGYRIAKNGMSPRPMHDMEMGDIRGTSIRHVPDRDENSEKTPLKVEREDDSANFSTFKVKGKSALKSSPSQQSPVNIDTSTAVYEEKLCEDKLVFSSQKAESFIMTNTGSTVSVSCKDDSLSLEGGPLNADGRYHLSHIALHWGSVDTAGSQHTVDNKRYSGEIDFVFWDRSRFASYSEAAGTKEQTAIAIVAVFVQLGSEHNKLALITDSLSCLRYKGDSLELINDFDPMSLFPECVDEYWTYSGSQTSPPHTENVTWIVFRQPIQISSGQMHELRTLKNHEKDEDHDHEENTSISDNYRTLQPLDQRAILASFK